jgi:hypothetical protein
MSRLPRNDEPDWVREGAPDANAKQCGSCSDRLAFWHELHQGSDGRLRCSSCHMIYLRAMRARPGDRCMELGCTKTVDEHRAEFRALVDKIGQPVDRWRTTPSYLERRGIHPLRESVRRAQAKIEASPPTASEREALERRKAAELAKLERAALTRLREGR